MKNVVSYTDDARFGRLAEIKRLLTERFGASPRAYLRSYGCQQSVSDGERLRGLLAGMGFSFTDEARDADMVLMNTCAVRENAEDRVYGNLGALSHVKKSRPEMIIAVTGCMTQQTGASERIKKSFPYVDIVAGTNAAGELPELLYRKLSSNLRCFAGAGSEIDPVIFEDMPVRRESALKAYVPVMYGCNNFCSYCVVPYVRGRERSREPEKVAAEVSELVNGGCRDITLLGQNVNSYGKGLPGGMSFAELLRRVNGIPGDFRVRFMTSHPKDCTAELLDAMRDCEKVCGHLHLAAQSGSDRILAAMNRHYTREKYLSLLREARERMPELSVTSDIMVGFPGETRTDFEDTLRLVREAEFSALYTFIYSPRQGTPAAELPDPVPAEEKSGWFRELLALQEKQGRRWLEHFVGGTLRVLPESEAKAEGRLTARTGDNTIVDMPGGPELIGSFSEVRITAAHNTLLEGEPV